MALAQTVQNFALAVYEEGSVQGAEVVQLYALGVYDGLPKANYSDASQLFALAPYSGGPIEAFQNASAVQLFALGVYGEGSPEDFRVRAWAFTLDGHHYYALTLGELGTYICDTQNGNAWYKWETAGYGKWNAVLGLQWDGRVLAASVIDNILWEVSPENTNDEGFKDITHVTTAILNATMRNWVSLDEVFLSLSSGYTDSLNSTITFEYSDDRGVTWETPTDGIVTLTEADFKEQVQWQSLGSFTGPGRVIRITDVGGPLRIDYATAIIDGEE
jgi:hypothetical protein